MSNWFCRVQTGGSVYLLLLRARRQRQLSECVVGRGRSLYGWLDARAFWSGRWNGLWSMLEPGYNSYHTYQRYFLCYGWSSLLNPTCDIWTQFHLNLFIPKHFHSILLAYTIIHVILGSSHFRPKFSLFEQSIIIRKLVRCSYKKARRRET